MIPPSGIKHSISTCQRNIIEAIWSNQALGNFHLVPNLRILNLSYNDHKDYQYASFEEEADLNLAENAIASMHGIGDLPALRRLNLSGNRIKRISHEIQRLKNLEVLRLARNRLCKLDDVDCLEQSKNLASFSISGNPIADLPHSRQYIIFKLPTLDVLDSGSISLQDRAGAEKRFSRREIEDLKSEVETERIRATAIMKETQGMKRELQSARVSALESKKRASKAAVEAQTRKQQVALQSELLRRKDAELVRAREIMYGMEQKWHLKSLSDHLPRVQYFPLRILPKRQKISTPTTPALSALKMCRACARVWATCMQRYMETPKRSLFSTTALLPSLRMMHHRWKQRRDSLQMLERKVK